MIRPDWYTASTSGDQGLVIEESTGRNVAVTYRASDAPLVAAAPAMLAALQAAWAMLPAIDPRSPNMATYDKMRGAIASATESAA